MDSAEIVAVLIAAEGVEVLTSTSAVFGSAGSGGGIAAADIGITTEGLDRRVDNESVVDPVTGAVRRKAEGISALHLGWTDRIDPAGSANYLVGSRGGGLPG
jgi:hypothetical protein